MLKSMHCVWNRRRVADCGMGEDYAVASLRSDGVDGVGNWWKFELLLPAVWQEVTKGCEGSGQGIKQPVPCMLRQER